MTRFLFFLRSLISGTPKDVDPPDVPYPINQELAHRLSGLNLLYGENDEAIRQATSQTLSCYFGRVIEVEDGPQAWQAYQKESVHAIILDVRMPGLCGIELAKRVRAENAFIPILIISSYYDKPILMEAIKLQLVDFLVKPVAIEDLTAAIKGMSEQL